VRPLAQAAVIVSRLAGTVFTLHLLFERCNGDRLDRRRSSESNLRGALDWDDPQLPQGLICTTTDRFRLAGTLLRGDESPSCGYLAQMSAVGNAADPEVRTFWEDSYEAAAERVAGFAYAVAVRARDRATSPVWANWVSSDGPRSCTTNMVSTSNIAPM